MQSSDDDASDVESPPTSFRTRLSSFAYETPPRKSRVLYDIPTPPPSSTLSRIPRKSSSKKRKRKRCGNSESEDEDDVLPVLTATPSSQRKKRPKRGYAPPEVYDHLHILQDYLEPHLDVVFCGINPGCTSAEVGHHYAHPTNHFWRTLHESGLTKELIPPCEDYTLPQKYGYGLTNLVERPSAEQSELSTAEMREGVPFLMNKIAKYRPRIVCFLAKGIWEIFLREAYRLNAPPKPTPSTPKRPRAKSAPPRMQIVASKYFSPSPCKSEVEELATPSPSQRQRKSRRPIVPKYDFDWGLQPFKVEHRRIGTTPLKVKTTLFFVVPSPSARVVAYQWWDKIKFFVQLREFIQEAKTSRIDTSSMSILPLTTNRSIYFLVPQT